MKKTTPMILVAMLMLSLLSSIDIAELQETIDVDESSARAGADAEVIAITSPKETVCTQAGCRNTLNAGEATNFEAYIQNSGDVDITEMSYSVTVYLDDGSGGQSMIAKDAAGNDLQWQNTDVICGSASLCDFTSLAASGVLGGGKYTLMYGGNPIAWTPIPGDYIIQISADAPGDVDAGNDAQTIEVTVVNWYDIQVDLSWDSGEAAESGPGVKAWTLSVLANGSDTFNPREVVIRLKSGGDVTGLTSTVDGDLLGGAFYDVTVGTATTVETFTNVSTEPPTITNATRNVLAYNTEWTYTGELTFDSNKSDSIYELTAQLLSYTQYSQWDSCVETDPTTNETLNHICEEEFTQDSYPETNEDEILGSASTYHDIRVARMTVAQGYNADGTGNPTSMMSDDAPTDLNVGVSYFHVEVEHRGSDPSTNYAWDATLTVTDEAGESQTVTANSCETGIEPAYTYKQLGTALYDSDGDGNPDQPGELTGYACMMVTLDSGEHTFSVDLELVHKDALDARPSNNDRTMTVDVRNNNPLILSLDLMNEGDLFTNQEEPLQLSAQVFDVDEPSGLGLEYSWTYSGAALPGCERSTTAQTCTIPVLDTYVLDFPISFTVYDSNGGSTSEEMMLFIWNNGGASATTDSGLSVSYALKYKAPDAFSLTATDADLSNYENKELPGYSGTYSAVGAINYAPSTTYSASDVLEQSMDVTLAKSLEATSLWYVTDSGLWTLIVAEPTDVDATTEMFAYDIPADSPVLSAGALVLMGGSLAQADVPDASITGFSAAASRGGAIVLNWDVEGTMLASDSIDVTICEGEAGCNPATFFVELGVGTSTYKYSGTNTEHGVFYNVLVEICNDIGCSTPKGVGNVTADKSVDGGVSAMNFAVSEAGEQWIVDWDATGETFDVASWDVCYQRGTFDAANMPDTCASTATTDVVIDKPEAAGTYTYYFTAVPVDALGNYPASGALNSIDYQRDADTSNEDDGTNVTGDVTAGEVPTWTWGVIGGVVFAAFIVGAFILSRGGEDDENKDWDY